MVNVNNSVGQYFSLLHKTLSISSSQFSINLQVLKFTSKKATNINKMVSHTIPYFTSIYITFVYSLLFFKASCRPNTFFTTTFAGYQINNTSTLTFQNPFILYFRLVAKQVKSGETTKKLLQIPHFLLHLSIEHSLCLFVDCCIK